MQPVFKVNFDNAPKPPVVLNTNEFSVNISLDFVEAAFASFILPNVDLAIKNGANVCFIGSKNLTPTQTNFDAFLKHLYPKLNVFTNDRNVLFLIISIWLKSRNFVDMKLEHFEKTSQEEESNQVQIARSYEERLRKEDFLGKMFTKRQAEFILITLEEIRKKGEALKNQTS